MLGSQPTLGQGRRCHFSHSEYTDKKECLKAWKAMATLECFSTTGFTCHAQPGLEQPKRLPHSSSTHNTHHSHNVIVSQQRRSSLISSSIHEQLEEYIFCRRRRHIVSVNNIGDVTINTRIALLLSYRTIRLSIIQHSHTTHDIFASFSYIKCH